MPIPSCRQRRRPNRRGCAGRRGARGSLRFAVLVVLRKIGPEVVGLVLVLDAGEDHLGAGNLPLGILDIFEEDFLAPGDAGILVGVGIGIALDAAGLAAVEAVEHRADLVLGAFPDRVASQALVKGTLAGVDILRQRAGGGEGCSDREQRAQGRSFHGVLFISSLGAGRFWHGRFGKDSRSGAAGFTMASAFFQQSLAMSIHPLTAYPKRA